MVCRWLDRVFYMDLWAARTLPIYNPHICSQRHRPHCLWQDLPFARSSIPSATLGSLVTSESLFTHMLTCHRPTLSPTVFAVGSIGYSLWKFSQLAFLRLTIHKYSHMPSPTTVSDRFCRSLDRVFPMETWAASILPINNPQIYSLSIADTVSGSVCRWLDRVFYLYLQTVSLSLYSNPQIYSLAIAQLYLWQCLPCARSNILSASLFSFLNSKSVFKHMLSCHRPTLPRQFWALARTSILSASLGS